MDRIHALTLTFPEPLDADTLQAILDNGGEYASYDPVTGQSNVVWFESLDEDMLNVLTDKAAIFSGTETRYVAATGEVDENGDAMYEPVTKERFTEQKAAMISSEKLAVIKAGKSDKLTTAKMEV